MLWITVLFLPGCVSIFFVSGPFAWSVLIALWIPASAFGLPVTILASVMLTHVKLQGTNSKIA